MDGEPRVVGQRAVRLGPAPRRGRRGRGASPRQNGAGSSPASSHRARPGRGAGTSSGSSGGHAKSSRRRQPADAHGSAVGSAAVEAKAALSKPKPRAKKGRIRRKSQLLSGAVSKFVRGKKKDVVITMAEMRQRAKETAHNLRSRKDKHYNLALMNARGLPVREGLQAMYKLERNRSIRSALFFLFHFAVFLYIVSGVFDSHESFTTNNSILDLFLDEPFDDATYKKNFYEVMTHGEFWTWVEGPMVKGLYQEEWYNGDPLSPGETGFVLHNLRVVGGVRMRQMRIRPNSCRERRFVDLCTVKPWNTTRDGECVVESNYDAAAQTCCVGRFDTKAGSCYTTFEAASESTDSFGPLVSANSTERLYTWSDGHSALNGLFGFGAKYGTGGFVTDLPADNTGGVATARIAELKANRWTDESTAAVAVYFNLYDTNTRLLSSVRILFEFFPTGHVIKSAKIYTVQLVVYEARMDKVRLAVEVLFLVTIAVDIYWELKALYHSHRRKNYFKKFRHLYEIALVACEIRCVMAWLEYILSKERTSFDVNAETYVDMYNMAESALVAFSWAGLTGLACALKTFQYMSLSKKLNTLWLTLERAASDLAAFFVGFMVVVSGFAFAAEHLFGFVVAEFHNFTASFSTLLRFILGIFDYKAMQLARPALAPWFFAFHVFVMMMVVLNMFVAIVTKYFDEVHEEVKLADRWQENAKSYEGDVVVRWTLRYQRCRRLCCKSKQMIDSPWEAREQSYEAENAFYQALDDCNTLASRGKDVKLFDFFYQHFQQQDADHEYIGIHELCQLFNDYPCPPGKHHMKNRKCQAFKLLTAYNEWKTVIMLGEVHRHKLVASDVQARGLELYTVTKVNMEGIEQVRQMCIDNERRALLNFDRKMRLKKSLKLHTLTQVSQSGTDENQLTLLFADLSMAGRVVSRTESGEKVTLKPETMYNLRFMSAMHKEVFLKKLIEGVALAESAAASESKGPSASDESEETKSESTHVQSRKRAKRIIRSLKTQVEELTRRVHELK